MDQMACAVGGFVFIDFEDAKAPVVEPIEFSLTDAGYSLCIVNTGGNHANLNDDYASVPAEMKGIAALLGRDVLRGFTECDIVKAIPALRKECANDRAIMRALHFVRENARVNTAKDALKSSDVELFFENVFASGRSSFQYLQYVYTTKNPTEQVTVIGAMTYTEGTTLGDGKATGKLIWPVPYTKHITSYYGARWGSFHYGIDVSASGINGKALIACDGGTVVKANSTNKWGGGWGYYVLIDHGNGYQTRYAHCSKVVVKVGQKVAQGELVAYVGNTGNSTGPHLHMEVLLNGKRVDPLPYFKASGTYK
jgi:murein DD-endopeptidase MepM/ murein hydrolase activator NlpD